MSTIQEVIKTFTFLNHKLDPSMENETLLAARKELTAMINIVKIQIISSRVNETSSIKELAAARQELFDIWKTALDPYESDVCGFAYDCMSVIEAYCTKITGRQLIGCEYLELAQ